ncbi:T9SS type A sorting domain-containing protein [Kaistella pullorum]|uniref:T9SS type A sorting domain-containing protein n=1 Tax=Kaistella pullorum TaxID=2763074 RepID=A0ABR8WJF0_9FLAO|nr:T9SS type A sorting domain-containing protein [Kaistella pullorum]MBD8017192.1 T9SS type A sorting domain-containing protein [Kaistella pullorum]
MKKLSSLVLMLMTAISAFGQFTVQVTAPGVVQLTYGAANDYSIYSPGFEVPTFWVHVWSNAGDNSTGSTYNDSWSNSNVEMNWNATANAYTGTINLNTKIFTDGNRVFPTGTTVNNLGFVFKNQQNGATNQSGDLTATNFGFTPTTLVSLAVSQNDVSQKAFVADGKLFTPFLGKISVTVYDMSGKIVKCLVTQNTNAGIDLGITQSGNYVAQISSAKQTETVKFRK